VDTYQNNVENDLLGTFFTNYLSINSAGGSKDLPKGGGVIWH